MQAWYLIHTKPRQERLALENLARQGYTAYLPLARLLRRRRGRSIPDVGPLFPRYLFLYLSDQTDNWKPIRSTVGVQTLVRFGEQPARVPDALVETLKARENGEGIQELPSLDPEPGETVRISHGPFEGYTAIFQARTSRERVILLLDIAEKSFRLEADSSTIERC